MAFGADTEKTEQPTGKRIGKARNKGNIAFSSDLNNAVVLLASIERVRGSDLHISITKYERQIKY